MAIYQGDKLLASDINVKPGTTDYNDLSNKPSINGITLDGNKTVTDLNLQSYISLPGNTDLNTITTDGYYKVLLKDNTNYNQPIYNTTLPENNISFWTISFSSTPSGESLQYPLGEMIAFSPNVNSLYPTIYARKLHPADGWQPWYQIAGSGLDMPSKKAISITPGTDASTYTVPANGYIGYRMTAVESSGSFLATGRYLSVGGVCNVIGYYYNFTLPVEKGETVTIYHTGVTFKECYFVYANSEVPMNERFPASTTISEEPAIAKVTSTKKTRSKKASS